MKSLSFKLPARVRAFSDRPVPWEPQHPETPARPADPEPARVQQDRPEPAIPRAETGLSEQIAEDYSAEDGEDQHGQDAEERHITGHTEDYAEELAQQRQELEKAVEALQQAIAGFADVREKFRRDFEVSAVKLVYEIATKVIHKELATSPDIILYQIQETLKNVADDAEIRIRCHPADHDFLTQETEFVTWLQNTYPACRVVPDETVGRGGCIVETAGEVHDATIESQLAEIRKHLSAKVEEHA